MARLARSHLHRRFTAALVATVAAGAGVAGAGTSAGASVSATTRIAGSSRYETAAALSASAFTPGVSAVYLATGTGFADALAAGPAASAAGGPVLLTDGTTLPSATATELTRLRPAKVILAGGLAAVSDAVAAQAGAAAGAPVTRIAGSSRYETAAALSASSFSPGVSAVYLATGAGFADALAAGPAAASLGGPVLLTDPASLPSATAAELGRLHPAKVIVAGGQIAVSDDVSAQAGVAAGAPVTRVAGADRYETAALLSAAEPGGGALYAATGATFADALAAGPAVAHVHGTLVLVSGVGAVGVPAPVANLIVARPPSQIVVVGGLAAVDGTTASLLPGLSVPGVAEYTFSQPTKGPAGGPMRWNPCATIHYVVNTDAAPAGAGLADVQAAMAQISAATGMSFVNDGVSHAVVSDTPSYPAVLAGTKSWAPLLISFEHEAQTSLLPHLAYTGWTQPYVDNTYQIVSGFVLIDVDQPSIASSQEARVRTLMHELGHAVGLGHTTSADPTEVMYPGAYVLGTLALSYGPGDLNGLRHEGRNAGCLVTPTVP